MSRIQNRRALLMCIAGISIPAIAYGHGANFEVGAVGNQLVTTHFFLAPNEVPSENYDPYYAGNSTRWAVAPLVDDQISGVGGGIGHNGINNNGWYGQPDLNYLEGQGSTEVQVTTGGTAFTGPGIAWGADGNGLSVPAGGSITLTETIAAPLQVWNASSGSFQNCVTDQLEGIRGSIGGLTATSLYSPLPGGYNTPGGSTESPSWSSNKTASGFTDDTHNQVEWRLDSINDSTDTGTETPDLSPADGIYLATLTVNVVEYNASGGVYDAFTPSLPFYVLFDKDGDPDPAVVVPGSSPVSYEAGAAIAPTIDPATFSSELSAAEATLPTAVVPEPTTLSVLASLMGLGLLRRRRPISLN